MKQKTFATYFTFLLVALIMLMSLSIYVINLKLDFILGFCSKPEPIPMGIMNGLEYRSWTKAIYEGNVTDDVGILRDYYIECDGDIILRITPTKDFIYVKSDWKHPYPEFQNRWCEL